MSPSIPFVFWPTLVIMGLLCLYPFITKGNSKFSANPWLFAVLACAVQLILSNLILFGVATLAYGLEQSNAGDTGLVIQGLLLGLFALEGLIIVGLMLRQRSSTPKKVI